MKIISYEYFFLDLVLREISGPSNHLSLIHIQGVTCNCDPKADNAFDGNSALLDSQ